jgi:hypothetical protein
MIFFRPLALNPSPRLPLAQDPHPDGRPPLEGTTKAASLQSIIPARKGATMTDERATRREPWYRGNSPSRGCVAPPERPPAAST